MASHNLNFPGPCSLVWLQTPQGHTAPLCRGILFRLNSMRDIKFGATCHELISRSLSITSSCPNHEVEQGRAAGEGAQDQAVIRHPKSTSGVSPATHLPHFVTGFRPPRHVGVDGPFSLRLSEVSYWMRHKIVIIPCGMMYQGSCQVH